MAQAMFMSVSRVLARLMAATDPMAAAVPTRGRRREPAMAADRLSAELHPDTERDRVSRIHHRRCNECAK